jgi:signal transduction histidine kinase
MIRDLLDFARGRLDGRFPISLAPIDARVLIADTVAEIAAAHPERAIDCRTTHAAGDFDVHWDGDRVAQAITNLVSNAIAHGTDPIVVEPSHRDGSIAIDIRNRGEIPEQVRPHLFAPFSLQGDDRRHHTIEGAPRRRRGHLGLGLYIVREIATAHGGAVKATSEGGHTTFTLTLPRDGRSSEAAAKA